VLAEEATMLTLDLSINPDNPLMAGLGVELVGGRGNLPNAMAADTLNRFGANVLAQVQAATDRELVVLTGPCAVQLYLVAFHAVVHAFSEVRYRDGKGGEVTISKHG